MQNAKLIYQNIANRKPKTKTKTKTENCGTGFVHNHLEDFLLQLPQIWEQSGNVVLAEPSHHDARNSGTNQNPDFIRYVTYARHEVPQTSSLNRSTA